MATLFDLLVRHRLDVAKFGRREASVVLGLMAREDAELVALLRRVLPGLPVGNVAAAPTQELLRALRELRRTTFGAAHDRLAGDLVQLGQLEGDVIGRLTRRALGVPVAFNPVREGAIRSALARPMFSGVNGTGRTLQGWFDAMRAADQGRLVEAVQLGVLRQEPVDDIVRRIAGTRANRYADGLLAVGRREAETAAITAVVTVANQAQVEWGKANADVVVGMQRVEMMDERTCEECQGEHGKLVPTGARVPEGYELTEPPPAHPRCRGALLPELDLDALVDRVPDEPTRSAA